MRNVVQSIDCKREPGIKLCEMEFMHRAAIFYLVNL